MVKKRTSSRKKRDGQTAEPTTPHFYVNAKVVLLGESGVGKSGLGNRIAEGRFQRTESTHGTQFWHLPLEQLPGLPSDVQAELILWDLAGQPEYRLTHQLFLDDSDAALLLFDSSDPDDPFRGVPYWAKVLTKHAPPHVKKFLVSSRCDVSPVMVDRATINQTLAAFGLHEYFKTSAATGEGVELLFQRLVNEIPWDRLPRTSTPRLFQGLRMFLLERKQAGANLMAMQEIRRGAARFTERAATDEELRTVVQLLQNHGLVHRLDHPPGNPWVLLKPEKINQYAASIIHAARNHPQGVGAVPERDVLTGNIASMGFERLPQAEEALVLEGTVELLLRHDLGFREMGYLIFPSQINITRQAPDDALPRPEVVYRFSGSIETIYASLVMRVSYTDYFQREAQWKYAVEFSRDGNRLGFSMQQIDEGTGELEIYFQPSISDFDRVTFIRFIADHLRAKGTDVQEQVLLYCPNCSKEVTNREAIEARIRDGELDIPCQFCDTAVVIPESREEIYRRYPSLAEKQQQLAEMVEERTRAEVDQFRADQQQYASDENQEIHILHLSDLHFAEDTLAGVWRTQLETDLIHELGIRRLGYLIISGDVAFRATEKEYDAAFAMVDGLVKRFGLDSSRVLIVPGNHDLNWDLSEKAYPFVTKRNLPTRLPEGRSIPAGEAGALLRDDVLYRERFANFNTHFYRRVYIGQDYPLDYANQFLLIERPEDRILFLGLNSSWELDHHFRIRASINMPALSLALDRLQDGNYNDWLKVAVWHHPVTGMNAAMQMLAVNGFQICMHGHIHQAFENFHHYDERYGIHIIGAGTFGAPAAERFTSVPLQYNLLTFDPKTGEMTVNTRRKDKSSGAWSGDMRWGDKNEPKPWYRFTVNFKQPKAPAPALNQDWQGIIDQARSLIAKGKYLPARRRLCEIPQDQHDLWKSLRTELAFVFNFELNEDEDKVNWENRLGQVEWRRKVWAALTLDRRNEAADSSDTGESENKDSDAETQDSHDKTEGQEDQADSLNLATAPIKSKSSEAKGEALEQDTHNLIIQLFAPDGRDVYWKKIRQQSRSSQFGCDIKSVHRRAGHDRDIRCLVECKSHERDLDFSEVLAKVFDAKINQPEIDHWILVAPRARIGNLPDGLIERWNLEQEFPFAVQLWTNDTDIGQFFGLDPDVYDRWIDHRTDQPHPRDWTSEQKQQVRQAWLQRFDPPSRLPQAWANYVTDRTEAGLFIENDDRTSLTELWKKDRHIPPRALDASRTPLPTPLAETIEKWLGDEESRVLMLLADFGDGKTAFSYMFVRHLLEEYRQNPQKGWIPIRFALRRFGRPNYNSRQLLRDRLDDLGSSVNDFGKVVEAKNVVVILDGMDEMTKSLTAESVNSVVDLLCDCCNAEFERVNKLILTCRTPFFEELAQREVVEDKLRKPRILYIEPFERRRIYEKLSTLAVSPAQRLKLHTLRQLHDPIGLARKALFFKMVSENFADPQSDFSSETAIYETYINNCLTMGKRTELLASSRQGLTEGKLRNNLLSIMETVAMEIHLSDKDYVCLRNVKGKDAEYARILWEGIEDKEEMEEDALHRVGVRSLLQKKDKDVDEEDRKLWPVDFCHRSIRELFVARGIERALRQSVNVAVEVLKQVDFNHEIIRFTAALMKTSAHDYRQILREIAFKESRIDRSRENYSEENRNQLARLGRTSVTLLYKWLGELPGQDWSNLTLDGAQLPGVDLTGKNLSNTSLRSANLNNAVFVDADFRGADLSGARLEETGEVLSVAVPRNLDGFFAAYHDGVIRQWSLGDRSEEESKVVYELSEKSRAGDSSLQVSALPGEGLCVYSRDNVVFLNLGDGAEEAGVFSIHKRFLSLTFEELGIAAIEKRNDAGCTIRVFDFSKDNFRRDRSLVVERCVRCERLGQKGIVVPREDGHLIVYPFGMEEPEVASPYIQLGEFASPSAIASIGVTDTDQRVYLIACGGQDGTVGLWRLKFGDNLNELEHEEIFRQTIHQDVVTALSFAGPDILLSGGRDRRICHLDIPIVVNPPTIRRTYELKLQCKGMRIDGVRGERERMILMAALQGN